MNSIMSTFVSKRLTTLAEKQTVIRLWIRSGAKVQASTQIHPPRSTTRIWSRKDSSLKKRNLTRRCAQQRRAQARKWRRRPEAIISSRQRRPRDSRNQSISPAPTTMSLKWLLRQVALSTANRPMRVMTTRQRLQSRRKQRAALRTSLSPPPCIRALLVRR